MIRKTKNLFHLLEALVANLIYGFPSKKIFIIGVTGTDGKTTTTNLIYHLLKQNGKKTAMISSVGAAIGNKVYDIGFHVTTPSSFSLQKYIRKAVEEKNEYLVLEVTSHSLDQNRVSFIDFQIGVITNVTHEHLDYHRSYEKYLAAKLKLLKRAEIAIVNKDDESYKLISKIKNQRSKIDIVTKKWVTYGLDKSTDVNPKVFPFKTNLIGEFNRYNCLAAIAVCQQLGLKDEQIREALLSFQAPIGRQEIVYDKDFKVMIDFAHTPNALEVILPEVRKIIKGRLIHVFGSAGKRDETKRPLMGEASAKYSDIIVLTAEDPRDESLERIIDQIAAGIKNSKFEIRNSKQIQNSKFTISNDKKYVFKIPDRKEAIELAISIAQKEDLVICTGKSHEKSMNLDGKHEIPWNEFEIVKEAIKKKQSKKINKSKKPA